MNPDRHCEKRTDEAILTASTHCIPPWIAPLSLVMTERLSLHG